MPKKIKSGYFILFNILLTHVIYAQSPFIFEKGLFLPLDLNYGRDAIVEDKLAYQLFTGAFSYPSNENEIFTFDGEEVMWKSIQADSAGNFSGELLSDGYLYLAYDSETEKTAVLNISGHNMLFFNGVPHVGDVYKHGWFDIPIKIKKGRNDILIRCSRWARWQGIQTKLLFPEKEIWIDTLDTTLPHIVTGEQNQKLLGAVVIINASNKELNGLEITSSLNGKTISSSIPAIPALTSRKVPFYFDASAVSEKGSFQCLLQVKNKSKALDEKEIQVEAVLPQEQSSHTFISDIDGSVQYYAVTPQSTKSDDSPALFLSVHGAGVEAIGQARAYDSKDWGVLIAPTNRRPRGFNWEEWGRMDALEVLEIAKEKFHPDPKKIYLTGHSMGGHGTWYLGATYPGKWAAIGPCAGYPTLTVYGSSDGKIPEEGNSEIEKILHQASNPSNVIDLAKNYNAGGIYIHHGDSDKVVSVDYSRQMREVLGEFHKDFSYYEYPGGSHWFGDESVDWPPMFEYFKWHTIPNDSLIDVVDFTTTSPTISSQYFWVNIIQQERSLELSKVNIKRSKPEKKIYGTTSNVATLSFDLHYFTKGDSIKVVLDDHEPIIYVAKSDNDRIFLQKPDAWLLGEDPDPSHKGLNRGAGFKEGFNHKMVFVYGTNGNKDENKWAYEKAIFDAEAWYYRGNGAIDVIADKDFNPSKYPDRGVIIYGNAKTNSAWKKLLADCPIQVQPEQILVGDKTYTGANLGAYFMWPRADSETASIAIISGTGLEGMNATLPNQYFAAASGFPDFMIFSLDMLKEGAKGIKCSGFYTNDWKIDMRNSAFTE